MIMILPTLLPAALAACVVITGNVAHAFSPAVGGGVCSRVGLTQAQAASPSSLLATSSNDDDEFATTSFIGADRNSIQSNRRTWLRQIASASSSLALTTLPSARASALTTASTATASKITDASSGLLPDLPPEAVRSYLQYRFPLQLAADFYIFDLQNMVSDTDEFGAVSELVASKGARGGQGGASRIEREYVNPMRIIGLSMPPEYADDIRESQFAFERAMGKLTKATAGIRRDLPVEIDGDAVPKAEAAWEEGRLALNSFFVTLNSATGLEGELKVIPPAGPNQAKEYGRSVRRYNEFTKKTKLCQNRGGPTLSAAWGQLMVTGYLQDSCGVEPLDGYFFQ